jgi:O-antigen ligase
MASTPSRAGRARRLLFLLHVLALAAALLGAAAVAHQQRRATRGIVAGLPDPALADRPASIVGLNVALEQYADPALVLASLHGLPWLRQTFPWDRLEPAPGAYDWTPWDRLVEAAAAGGHRLIAVLNHSPEWARAPGLPAAAPPASPADFARFAGAFAARYGDRIDVYQIWDEPNLLTGWGNQPPSAAAYAALLQAAHTAIHAADPTATVLAAALAPTVEAGPDNLSDLLYLQQLYDLGAAPYFDAAAGKPYGFYTGPDDRLADPAVLNFSRFILLREVMVRNSDDHKLLWGGNYGWNNRPSPWGHASAADQRAFTLRALERAALEWPWAGVLALETLQPIAPPDDPRWGFALFEPSGAATPLLADLQSLGALEAPARPGNHPAQHPAAAYAGAWEFSDLGADIPDDYANASVAFTFWGSEAGLRVRRGDYRAHLYVTVDGQPANRLPTDEHGAYLILTAPEKNTPQVATVLVASGLAPGPHTLTIRPERGWDQWALVGFAVGGPAAAGPYRLALAGLLVLAAFAAAGAAYLGRGQEWGRAASRLRSAWERLGGAGQAALAVGAGVVLYLTSWLTWGQDVLAVTRRSGDAVPLLITALTAGLFYFSPSLLLALAALAALFVIFYLRPDLGLALVALFIPFFLHYRLLWQRGFSMAEVCTLLTLGAVALRWVATFARAPRRAALGAAVIERFGRLSSLDCAALAYLLIATLSTAQASILPVAFREYRLVILEPVIFYGLVRAVRLNRPAMWRLVDFFVLGAVLVAGYGLYQAEAGVGLITAEGGVARITSVYGSPNNLALYLGRALPLAAAGWLLGGGGALPRWRRWAYALAFGVMLLAAALTFSRGALLLGLPAGLAVVLIAWLGRRGWWLTLGAAAAGLASLPLLARLPRFASLLDFTSGTSFFRVRLWLSAWRMFRDHPWLGVGPDNFLYLYRSRYILPEAWQEPNLSHPHNLALDFLSRLGVLGFAAGLWLVLGFWRVALALHRRLSHPASSPELPAPDRRALLALNAGLMGLVAAMLAHGLVDHGLFLVDLSYAFFLALALVQHTDRLASSKSSL